MPTQSERDVGSKDFIAEQVASPVEVADVENEKAPTAPAATLVRLGGLRSWFPVLGAFCIIFNCWGIAFAFGSFQSFYTLEYIPSADASAISWVGTIQSFLLIVGGIVSGPVFDIGYFYILIILGSFLSVFGMMMLSISTEFYQILLSQGICMGLGFGLLYVPTIAYVNRGFAHKRAIALGIASSGAPAGGIIYTLMFQQLMPQVDFEWTVRIMGFLMLFLFALAAFLVLWKSWNIAQSQIAVAKTRRLFDTRALRDLPFWSYTLANFFLYLGYMTPFFYMPIYAETKLHTSRSLALYILIISQASSIVGRVVTTSFAHRYGSMIPWIFCATVSATLCLAWISANTLVRFILYAAFYGGISGALIPLPPSVFPHVCPEPTAFGTWLGMSQSLTSVSTLVGAPIAGALASIGSSGSTDLNFLNIQLFGGIVMMSGSIQLLGLWLLLYKTRDKKGLI